MARIDLRCTSCAFMFHVSDAQTAKGPVKCPSCLAVVGVDGPVAGGARRGPKVMQAAPDVGGQRMKLILLIAGGGVLVLVVVVALMMGGGSPPPEPAAGGPSTQLPRPKQPVAPAPKPAVPETPKPAAGAAPAAPSAPVPVVQPAAAPVQAPAAPAVVTLPIPAEVLAGLRDDLLGYKEWHLNLALSAADCARVEPLVKAGRGEQADLDFLKAVHEHARVRAVREEVAALREGIVKTEKEAFDGLPVDRVDMKDGREIQGKIVEETAELVKIERKIAGGSTAVSPLNKDGVKAVLRGKGLGNEFKTRWEAAQKGGVNELVALLAWCKEGSLGLQSTLVANALLIQDPGRPEARQQLGLSADPVARMLEAEKQGGFISYNGRRWVPKELKDKLIRDGYALVEGRWVARKEKMISVPGLFRYERQESKPVSISGNGATVSHEVERIYSPVQDVASGTFTEKEELKLLRRFWAPPLEVRQENAWPSDQQSVQALPNYNIKPLWDKPVAKPGSTLRGEVMISVPLDAPLLGAQVMTLAEVKPGASITVSVLVDGRREKVYDCQAKEDKTRRLPDSIRGKTQVDLSAEIVCTAVYKPKVERRRVAGPKKQNNGTIIQPGLEVVHYRQVPEYQALLFPSNSNTIEVFRLTAELADPAPALDKLFENAQGVLK
jgi:hypothetical protein